MMPWMMGPAVAETRRLYPDMARRGWVCMGYVNRQSGRSEWREIRIWARRFPVAGTTRIFWSLLGPTLQQAPIFVKVSDPVVLGSLAGVPVVDDEEVQDAGSTM